MAVNFYKFAAAIMELLEPDKYNFSTRAKQSAQPNEIAESIGATDQLIDHGISAADSSNPQINSPHAAEQETATVEIVAARLTETIANASEEKVQQIAQIIESVTAENKESAQSGAPNIIEKIEDESIKNQASGNTTEAASLVNATIKALAAEKVQEIQQTAQSDAASDSAKSVSADEAKQASVQNAAVANDLTEKLQETAEIIKETGAPPIAAELKKPAAAIVNSTAATPTAAPAAVKPLVETTVEEPVKPVDFWDLFPEIDPSEIKYFGAVSYLYDYMSSREMLDFLNPEIDLLDRLSVMTNVSQGANTHSSAEAQFMYNATRDTDSRTDRIRDTEQEDRNNKVRLQEEWQQRQRIDRQRFEERIHALRKDASS